MYSENSLSKVIPKQMINNTIVDVFSLYYLTKCFSTSAALMALRSACLFKYFLIVMSEPMKQRTNAMLINYVPILLLKSARLRQEFITSMSV